MIVPGIRLKYIENTAGNCEVLGDIGTDHGILPAFSVLQGHCRKAIATDINRGPCERARNTVRENGLTDKIEVRQGPGLTVLKPGECDTVVIAGMGGNLIADILEESPEVAKSVKKFVLSPNSCENDMRRYLFTHGFRITDENVICEGNHEYLVAECFYTGEKQDREPEEAEFYTGTFLMSKTGDENVRKYFARVKRKMNVRKAGLLSAEKQDKAELELIENVLKELEKNGLCN